MTVTHIIESWPPLSQVSDIVVERYFCKCKRYLGFRQNGFDNRSYFATS